MKKIAIVYGSTTDNTKNVAKQIAAALSSHQVDVLDVAKLKVDELAQYPNLILGTSTWGSGDLQDDWDGFVSKLAGADLNGKVVALFGLGDSYSYSDTFADGMGLLFDAVKDKGCAIVGSVSPDGYSHSSSAAIVDGNFVGLPLDEDNESDQTDTRIGAWIGEVEPLLIEG